MQNKIKFLFSLIGAFVVIGASLAFLLDGKIPLQNKQHVSMCVDQYNTIEYRQIKEDVYCQTDDYKWHRLHKK